MADIQTLTPQATDAKDGHYRQSLDPALRATRAGRAAERVLATELAIRAATQGRAGVLPERAAVTVIPDILPDGTVITSATTIGYHDSALTRVLWAPGTHLVCWWAGRQDGSFHVCVDTPAPQAAHGPIDNQCVTSLERARLPSMLRRTSTIGAKAWVDAYQQSLQLLHRIIAATARRTPSLLDPAASVEDLVAATLTSGGDAHRADLITWLLDLVADGHRPPVSWATALRRNGRVLRRAADLAGMSETGIEQRLALLRRDEPIEDTTKAVLPPLYFDVEVTHGVTPWLPHAPQQVPHSVEHPNRTSLKVVNPSRLGHDEHESPLLSEGERLAVWANRWALATRCKDPRRLAATWAAALPGVPRPSANVWVEVASGQPRKPCTQLSHLWRAAFFAGQYPQRQAPELHDLWIRTEHRALWPHHSDPMAVWRAAVTARLRCDVPTVSTTANHRLLGGHSGLRVLLDHAVATRVQDITRRLQSRARTALNHGDPALASALRRCAQLLTPERVAANLPADARDLDDALDEAVRRSVAALVVHPRLKSRVRHVIGQ